MERPFFLPALPLEKTQEASNAWESRSGGAACVGVFLHNSSGGLGLFLFYRRKHVIANGVC